MKVHYVTLSVTAEVAVTPSSLEDTLDGIVAAIEFGVESVVGVETVEADVVHVDEDGGGDA